MKPTHLDLFSGIGGFALAAQWTGFETIGFSEIDPYASQVLKKHWPTIPNHGDINAVPTVRCDLITGGFPCQPFSLAGKRRGKADDRHLWPAMRDVIGRCRPAWVLGENVPGIIGVELDQVLADLESLGYRVQPFVIPACAVDAQHRRDRVWIVANARSLESGRLSSSGEQEIPAFGSNGEALADTASNARKLQQSERKDLRDQPAINGPEGATMANAVQSGLQGSAWKGFKGFSGSDEVSKRRQSRGTTTAGRNQWPTEPDVGRVADGVPNRAHRLRSLGNAIVPQVAQVILQAIHKELTKTRLFT